MRSAVLALARALVRLFYRRIEVSGVAHAPPDGPILFVANHPNGLVDPMVALAALPRPVVFVAKSTLWKIPVLRSILDLLGCVPVVRKGEGEPGISLKGEERNEAAFERLAAILDGDGAVLIFPEGRSHSDPRLSELRTGAARVLLLSKKSPVVVPMGLWFSEKEIFRSDVLVKLGAPVAPPADPGVEGWTAAMAAALEVVTLNADDWRDHEVAAAVDALYGERISEDFLEGEEGVGHLERSLRIRQLILEARGSLEETHPGEVTSLVRRVRALDHLLRKLSLSFSSLDSPAPARTILWHTLKALAVIVLGLPIAVLGVMAWWVPYRLCGFVAKRAPGVVKERDQIALYKLIAGVVLFPLALAGWASLAWIFGGAAWAALALALLPFAGISSLFFFEYASLRERQARELVALLFAPGAIARLRAERDALVARCDRLAEVAAAAADNRAP
ncbi:MAG: 1-acyl-sn-glycerol-3-phosphate acyltransferase [Acidobacteria bacterium]|nr:1-acyl-sn-glycerol-3-phosphate acyltransferase [Acidobacteriota bacterium]